MNKISYDNFAPKAAENAVVSSESHSFQRTEKLTDDRTPINYASFESQGINLLDSSLRFAESSDFTGFISSAISNKSSEFNGGIGLKLVFTFSEGNYSGPGITLHFFRHFCSDVTIAYYYDSTELFKGQYYPDSLDYFCEGAVEKYNKVVITFKASEIPHQFIKLSGLEFGNVLDINEFFGSINIFEELEPDCTDLPYDTCDFEAMIPEEITPQVGQSFRVYHNSQCFGKFTTETLTPNDNRRFIFEASDDKNILSNNSFPALASGTRTVDSLLGLIYESSDVTVDNGGFGNTKLTGFIQSKNCRYAAAMLSMGGGFFISSARNNKLRIFKMRDRRSTVIGADRILGKAKCKSNAPYTSITLYVHSGSEFDNDAATKHTVTASEVPGNVAAKELKLDKYSLFTDAKTRLGEIAAIGFKRNEIEAEIILQDEQIGDILSIETPQGVKTGILKSLDICIQGAEVTAKAIFIETEAV
ncbi:MAG: hypothetical protein IJD78_04210 [Clostridia bacterium]|nr:hypothetical protein [Clostridia bacterium]